ncbi:phytanoyl-CoA dioxygenase family protein [Paenibacillus validus]|uniref:Phytanoyl-CoA dioxygenase n=1 Tax=Paenibacillus validus TaxID=44253 RepID=A0A7X2ZBV5_9BACL|nr:MULTISPECIES: phytanoyl-CoA dioxygenase family protein [Paenibacillus]MED4599462.1 phytanoyl-CoA dioxygenase family protein [Paenibacillus validus]MED4605174.1 phytanoyl-CoA dioxygenase family protein [Paenibacillus validus]MUG71976.1 phytanoyl-CoA dioxygenase [Paenibacillus validus]
MKKENVVNNILETDFKLNQRPNNEPLRVLSEDDWKFWKDNGYVIIPNAVPQENIDRLVNLIWEFEEKNPNDPETWYTAPRREIQMKELANTGMVELYNHQYLWDNRSYERVYNAFVDIWGTEHLWASIDRCNLNLPLKPGHEYKGFIHWDVNTSLNPIPVNVQGVLSLVDTDAEMGGFQCIPELYRDFHEWVKTQPADRDPHKPDITGFTPTKITAKAGDLLIFNSMLAHGIRPNHSTKPRIAQYVSMFPAQEQNEALRKSRILSWSDRIPPSGMAFPGDPRNWEQVKYERAVLSELGEKLLGSKSW